jgi:hypothetical protein
MKRFLTPGFFQFLLVFSLIVLAAFAILIFARQYS